MEREQTTLRLPSDLLELLKEEAQERGYSFNSYMLFLIEIGHQAVIDRQVRE